MLWIGLILNKRNPCQNRSRVDLIIQNFLESIEIRIGRLGSRYRTEFTFRLVWNFLKKHETLTSMSKLCAQYSWQYLKRPIKSFISLRNRFSWKLTFSIFSLFRFYSLQIEYCKVSFDFLCNFNIIQYPCAISLWFNSTDLHKVGIKGRNQRFGRFTLTFVPRTHHSLATRKRNYLPILHKLHHVHSGKLNSQYFFDLIV